MEKLSKKVFVKTYGCQMNVYDSERMRDVLAPWAMSRRRRRRRRTSSSSTLPHPRKGG